MNLEFLLTHCYLHVIIIFFCFSCFFSHHIIHTPPSTYNKGLFLLVFQLVVIAYSYSVLENTLYGQNVTFIIGFISQPTELRLITASQFGQPSVSKVLTQCLPSGPSCAPSVKKAHLYRGPRSGYVQ